MPWYLFCLLLHVCFADIYCDDQSECAGLTLINLSGEIQCRAFDSCSDATTITTSARFYADGAYAAFNAQNVSSDTNGHCYGEFSCANINRFEININTFCDGYKSCCGSTIIRTASSQSFANVYLDGYKSAAHSTLNLHQNTFIAIFGALSLYNATLNMYKSSIVYAYQDFGLNGAEIHCESGQTCTIACYNYGCANISSINGDGVYNPICTHNSVSNILCNASSDITTSLSINFYDDLPSALTTVLFSPDLTDDSNMEGDAYLVCKNLSNSNLLGRNCGDYSECSGEVLTYTNKAICCTGEAGCQNGSAQLTINTTLIDNKFNKQNISDVIGIYCGGYQSCYDLSSGNNQFKIDIPADDRRANSNSFGIRNLYVSGNNTLRNISIVTELSINDNGTNSSVTLEIEGKNDYSYHIDCSLVDQCYIYCKSNTSCTNMILVCNGICYLDCGINNKSGKCPENISGTWYVGIPSQNSTVEPTFDPSSPPTNIPTTNPTWNPTDNPTTIPTVLPTIIPSNDPTTKPTTITTDDPKSSQTNIPTNVSTTASAYQTAHSTTQIMTTQGTESYDPNTWGIDNTVLLAVIILVGVLILVSIVLLFVYCHERLQGEKQQREVEMKQIMQKSLAALALKKQRKPNNVSKENNKVEKENDVRIKSKPIDLQKQNDLDDHKVGENDRGEGEVDPLNIDTEIEYSDDDEELKVQDDTTGQQPSHQVRG